MGWLGAALEDGSLGGVAAAGPLGLGFLGGRGRQRGHGYGRYGRGGRPVVLSVFRRVMGGYRQRQYQPVYA
ncbi:hypothetical protein XM38_031980 [Halomicronema hongdechloris C2206]|uniref:Uncharacterized protein n=1 Tax=Halomicronema hongdechloris C2206 TaxID=1641165 RepID=A0A1Z3HPK8_9CYAN|nr:hypothetical protein XM38_031980 [Halomicronema hongdechloris C2206]